MLCIAFGMFAELTGHNLSLPHGCAGQYLATVSPSLTQLIIYHTNSMQRLRGEELEA